jgi:hypothetical protein
MASSSIAFPVATLRLLWRSCRYERPHAAAMPAPEATSENCAGYDRTCLFALQRGFLA